MFQPAEEDGSGAAAVVADPAFCVVEGSCAARALVAAARVRLDVPVNVVAPGAIETDFGGGAVRDNAGLNQFIAAQTALGRVGQADDIGDAISTLLLPQNRWINAQRIEVSGGMFL